MQTLMWKSYLFFSQRRVKVPFPFDFTLIKQERQFSQYYFMCTLGVLATLNITQGHEFLKRGNYLQTRNPKFQKYQAKIEEVRALPCLAEKLPIGRVCSNNAALAIVRITIRTKLPTFLDTLRAFQAKATKSKLLNLIYIRRPRLPFAQKSAILKDPE